MNARPSSAEQTRQARLAFELALELGCTPREAAEELRRRAAMERHREAAARLAAKRAEKPLTASDEKILPWYRRDDL